MDPARIDIVLFCLLHDSFEHFQPLLSRLRDSGVITQQCNYFPSRICRHNREQLIDLITFHGYGINDTRSAAAFVCFAQHFCTRAVHCDRKICYALYETDHPFQRLNFYFLINRRAYINKGSACLCLFFCDIFDPFFISRCDCFRHGWNGTVYFFADNYHWNYPPSSYSFVL